MTSQNQIEATPTKCHVLSMPLELLLQCTQYLPTTDLGNFRRTCKHAEASLFKSFSHEFFTKRQFMLSEFSLQALVDISKSRYASSLSHVIFSMDRPDRRMHPPHLPMEESQRFVEQCADHLALISSNLDMDMISEAFSNLSSLETIGIRDFNSQSRNRDAPNGFPEWRSYGAATFFQETGVRIYSRTRGTHMDVGKDTQYLCRLFWSILRVVAQTSAPIKSFEVMLRNFSAPDSAFNMLPRLQPIVGSVIARLETLFLDQALDLPVVPGLSSTKFLRDFLSQAHDVKHLRLNLKSLSIEGSQEFLGWMTHTSGTDNITDSRGSVLPAPFSKLEQLDIGFMRCTTSSLYNLIKALSSRIRQLSFHRITLDYRAHHTNSNAEDPPLNFWAVFIKSLSNLHLKLNQLNFSYCSQCMGDGQTRYFLNWPGERDRNEKRWRGQATETDLASLAATAVLCRDRQMMNWANEPLTLPIAVDADSESASLSPDEENSEDEDDDDIDE